MNNEQRRGQRDFTKEGIIDQLLDTAFPMSVNGVTFSDTTPRLAAKIVDIIATTYGIPEVDHCYMCPELDNRGNAVSMNAVIYFKPDTNGGNITRPKGLAFRKGGCATRLDDGSVDLSGYVGNKVSTGGFVLSKNFKEHIAPIANLDDNGNIIVRATKNGGMAMVDVDFFKMFAVILKIDPTSNLDFEVSELRPIGDRDSLDYFIEVKKFVTPMRKKSNRGINYDDLDRDFSNRRGRRN